jgi:hypothetical protein
MVQTSQLNKSAKESFNWQHIIFNCIPCDSEYHSDSDVNIPHIHIYYFRYKFKATKQIALQVSYSNKWLPQYLAQK